MNALSLVSCVPMWRRKGSGLKLIVGSELRLTCGMKLVVLATDRRGYGRLCRVITRGRRVAEKGEYALTRADLEENGLEHCLVLWLPERPSSEESRCEEARWLGSASPTGCG